MHAPCTSPPWPSHCPLRLGPAQLGPGPGPTGPRVPPPATPVAPRMRAPPPLAPPLARSGCWGGQCLVRPHLGTEQTPLVFPKPPPESVRRALIAALGGASGSRPMRRRGVSRPSSPPHPPPRGHSDQKRWCPCPVTISDLRLGSRPFLLLTFVCTLVFLSQSLTL